MSFLDIIKNEQSMLEEQTGGNNEKTVYPERKHSPLFFSKSTPELLLQILPSADLHSPFAEPIRKILLSTTSSKGKDVSANFVLDPDQNPGSLLENKIKEWAERFEIPSIYGGQQTPRRAYLVNAVRIFRNQNNQFVQERDEHGQLMVRVLELPQSAYQTVLAKLQDDMINVTGSELSFMDVNQPFPIKIAKPAQGAKTYSVEVYTNYPLPSLGAGWESLLEDLKAHATPTERLENGDKWVQGFIDMHEAKHGRPTSRSNNQQGQAPQTNPYAQGQGQGQYQQPAPNPYQQAPSQGNMQSNTYNQGQNQQAPQINQTQYQQPNMNTNPNVNYTQQQSSINQSPQPDNYSQTLNQQVGTGIEMPMDEGSPVPDTSVGMTPPVQSVPNIPSTPSTPSTPVTPPAQGQGYTQNPNPVQGGQQQQNLSQQGNLNANSNPTQTNQNQAPNIGQGTNDNGLSEIDAMLQQELGEN